MNFSDTVFGDKTYSNIQEYMKDFEKYLLDYCSSFETAGDPYEDEYTGVKSDDSEEKINFEWNDDQNPLALGMIAEKINDSYEWNWDSLYNSRRY